MKKLKLNLQNMEGAEVLTREQLKKIYGGSSSTGSGDRLYHCCLKSHPDICNECTYVPSGYTIVCEENSSLKKC